MNYAETNKICQGRVERRQEVAKNQKLPLRANEPINEKNGIKIIKLRLAELLSLYHHYHHCHLHNHQLKLGTIKKEG